MIQAFFLSTNVMACNVTSHYDSFTVVAPPPFSFLAGENKAGRAEYWGTNRKDIVPERFLSMNKTDEAEKYMPLFPASARER